MQKDIEIQRNTDSSKTSDEEQNDCEYVQFVEITGKARQCPSGVCRASRKRKGCAADRHSGWPAPSSV